MVPRCHCVLTTVYIVRVQHRYKLLRKIMEPIQTTYFYLSLNIYLLCTGIQCIFLWAFSRKNARFWYSNHNIKSSIHLIKSTLNFKCDINIFIYKNSDFPQFTKKLQKNQIYYEGLNSWILITIIIQEQGIRVFNKKQSGKIVLQLKV